MKPTVGRIVHYIVPDHISPTTKGQSRAAIITRVWNDTCVNLHVFFDGDALPPGTSPVVTSVLQGTDEDKWMWPPREAA